MDEHPMPPDDEEPLAIADAESLLRGEPPPREATTHAPVGDPDPGPDAGYELEERPDLPKAEPPAPARPDIAPGSRPAGPSASESKPPPRPSVDPSEAVEEVWTRSAEWGGTLLSVAGVGVVVFVLAYMLVSLEEFGFAFLLVLVGGFGMVVLSYPILITLERPVRVTPEQAVRDYFAALSHHAPHFRRMWLLLSKAGRSAGGFASFDGFRRYWKGRIVELRGGRGSILTPLKFVVDDFKSEKSAGKAEIGVSFTVRVLIRGRQADGPIESVPVKTTLVKGPDRMWYLNRGTLP